MKFDAQGRQVVAVEVLADWTELTGIPERVLELAAIVDPGANQLLAWDDTLNDLVASNALPMTVTASWVFSGELLTRTHDEVRNILIDADGNPDLRRWEKGVEVEMLRSGFRTDADDGGEDWYQITLDEFGQIDTINLQGNELRHNGDAVLAYETTATTVGAAGIAAALPANPVGYLVVPIDGVLRKIPYYEV